MSRQRKTKRTRVERQDDSEAFERLQIQSLRHDFRREIDEILRLPPLNTISDSHDFLLKLGEITYLARRRREHEPSIRLAVKIAKETADTLDELIKHLAKIDIKQIGAILSISNELYPEGFPQEMTQLGLLRALDRVKAFLLALYASTQFATAIPDRPSGRGRPRSPYTACAWNLIDLWELTTAARPSDDSSISWLKRIPAPKKMKVRDGEYIIKQSATQFVCIALRMVDPTITDAHAITAIKNALISRANLYEALWKGLPQSFVGRVKTFAKLSKARRARASNGNSRVRKIKA